LVASVSLRLLPALWGKYGAAYSLRIDSITFIKAPRYTVSFDYNYVGAENPSPVTNIWGVTTDHPGYPVGTLPTPPDRSTENTPMYFTGWYNEDNVLVRATTSITGNWTLTARWSNVPSPQWVESISAINTSAPVYGFNITEGTLGDYDRIILKLKVTSAFGAQRRLRAWGKFTKATWFGNTLNADMQNAVGTGLLTYPGLDNIQNDLTIADGWKEFTLPLNNRSDAANWVGNETGLIFLAIGIIPGPGQSGTMAYLVKDIRLTNEAGTKTLEALHPHDTLLWGATNWARYVRGSNSDSTQVVTRILAPYEED